MTNKGTKMKLTKSNLNYFGRLFCFELGIMVREHERNNNTWDVEVDKYYDIGGSTWAPDNSYSFGPYKTLADVEFL